MTPLLLAFLVGATAIVGGRLGFSSHSTWVALATALIAVLIITALGFYYRQSRHDRLTDLRVAGDDLYYLGLLFTLVSLIMALVMLFVLSSPEGDALKQRTYDLIGNFGIALISTVAGILGRILLQSIEEDRPPHKPRSKPETGLGADRPERPTAEAGSPLPPISDDVIADVMALRRELREATDAFSHFTRLTQSQAEQIKAHSERLILEFNDRMSVAAERGLSEVMTAWRDLVQAVISDNDRLIKHTEAEVSAATARTETAWRGLAHAAATGTEAARRRLVMDAEEMGTMLERLAATNRGLEALVGGLEVAERGSRSLGETSASAATGLDDRAAEIVNAHNALARGAKNYQEVGLEAYRDAVSRFMEDASERLVREGNKWLESVRTVTESAKTQLRHAKDDAEDVRQLAGMISKEAERSLDVVERMRKSLENAVPVGVVPRGQDAPIVRLERWLAKAWSRWRR